MAQRGVEMYDPGGRMRPFERVMGVRTLRRKEALINHYQHG